MALPDLIEIVPLTAPVAAQITVPGSKSITNRALILSALADGETTLQGALWSEDTQVMVECLQDLGFMVNVAPDPAEPCNRTITVYGRAGTIPGGGTLENPLELFVGNAGTAARFLAALVCLGHGVYRLHGVPRMHERPQAALFQALRDLGYRVTSEKNNDKLPVVIHGGAGVSSPGGSRREEALTNRSCRVSIEESSQFASALLLCAGVGGWKIEVTGENSEESPYVAMTAKLRAEFRKSGNVFAIDADASSGSYFVGADWILRRHDPSSHVHVNHWPANDWQVDRNFMAAAAELGTTRTSISRQSDLGDSIMTAIVLAPLARQPIRFTDLGRLRVQECERVVALRTELTKCGAKVTETGDTLEVFPSTLHGAEIETYNDHRMAMCFAVLGLKVPGLKIKNPACVKKTFPNFFQKLAAAPPHGLGVKILDERGQPLHHEDLFAD